MKAQGGGGPRWLTGIDRLSTLLALLAGVVALAMMVNIVADVIGRLYLRPLPGTVDLTQFAWMPIVVSLGMGYALLSGQHIRIGLLVDSSSERAQRVVEVFAMAVAFATVAAFSWYGAERAFRGMQMGEFSSATPWLPIAVFRWVIVVGLVGLALQAVAQLVRAFTVTDFVAPDAEMRQIDDEASTDLLDATVEGDVR